MWIIGPCVTNIACNQCISFTCDLVGQSDRLAIDEFQVILSTNILQFFAVCIVGQSYHDFTSSPHKLTVQLFDGLWEIKHYFWDIGTRLDITPSFKLKNVALCPLYDSFFQPIQNASGCSIAQNFPPL